MSFNEACIRTGKACTLLFPMLIFCLGVHAQQLPSYNFTVRDGLPHSDIYRIMQDSQGFVWLSTADGVSVYNGRTFKNYKTEEGLSAHSVMSVAEGPDGEKWICTYGGKINIIRDRKITDEKPGGDSMPDYVLFSQPDTAGAWVITKNGGLIRLRITRGTSYTVDSIYFRRIKFHHILKRPAGEILFGSEDGLYTTTGNGSVKRLLPDVFSRRIDAICEGTGGAFGVACDTIIYQVQNNQVIGKTVCTGLPAISDMLADRQNRLWIAGTGSLITITYGKKEVLTYKAGLRHFTINDLYEDRLGNIWIATHGSGLCCIYALGITNFPVQEGINNYADAMFCMGNSIYAGSIGTVAKLSGDHFLPHPVRMLRRNDFIYFIARQNNDLYIGTQRGCIVQRHGAERMIAANESISICMTPERIWLGGFDKLGVLANGKYWTIDTTGMPPNTRFNSICSGRNGVVYFGTSRGLLVFDGKFTRMPVGSSRLSNSIRKVFCDHNGAIWIGTDSGLYILSRSNRIIQQRTVPAGARYASAVEDSSGTIWVGSSVGLYRLAPDGGVIQYDITSGLISNEVRSLCIDWRGRLWAGTVNGISCVSPDRSAAINAAPLPYITEAKVGSRIYSFPKAMSVPAHIQGFAVSFAAPDFPYADKVKYQYQISGIHHDWQSCAGNTIDIPSLPGGNYEFRVRASKNNGSWSKPARLSLVIETPFTETPLFFVLCAVAALLMTYVVFRWILLRKTLARKKQADQEVRMLHLRHQALSAMINPHFLFNCLNTIQGYIQKNDREAARTYLSGFSRLMRSTLEHSRTLEINLGEELARLRLYLEMEALRFGYKLRYSLQCDIDKAGEIYIPNMVVQPFIENAILHGIMPKKEGGEVNVHLHMKEDNTIVIDVYDTGIGITRARSRGRPAHKTSSLGMKLISDRFQLLQEMTGQKYAVIVQEIILPSGEVGGTHVQLVFPASIRELQA